MSVLAELSLLRVNSFTTAMPSPGALDSCSTSALRRASLSGSMDGSSLFSSFSNSRNSKSMSGQAMGGKQMVGEALCGGGKL